MSDKDKNHDLLKELSNFETKLKSLKKQAKEEGYDKKIQEEEELKKSSGCVFMCLFVLNYCKNNIESYSGQILEQSEAELKQEEEEDEQEVETLIIS